jgi:hypothetical protein
MTILDYRTAVDSTEGTQGRWLGWSVYLAMSWTWCIGMYLPVLLVRDYGVWGWVVFAVPNVTGAAAMGWMIRSKAHSRQIVAAHRAMTVTFSIITGGFQIFFALWMAEGLHLAGWNAGWVVPVVAAVFASMSAMRTRQAAHALALVVAVVSVLCAAQLARAGLLRLPDGQLLAPKVFRVNLASIAAVSAFGFLLCPYLDLTFHRARMSLTDREAPVAFGLGFGAIFALAIVFTLAYAPWLLYLLDTQFAMRHATAVVFAVYFLSHLTFTTAVHWQCVGLLGPMISTAIGIAGWVLIRLVEHPLLDSGELVYRVFMAFYALVFPAYVWICMIPSAAAAPSRRSWEVFGVAVLLAGPMFWLGFIENRMIWLLPGLAVVLLARLLVPAAQVPAPPVQPARDASIAPIQE